MAFKCHAALHKNQLIFIINVEPINGPTYMLPICFIAKTGQYLTAVSSIMLSIVTLLLAMSCDKIVMIKLLALKQASIWLQFLCAIETNVGQYMSLHSLLFVFCFLYLELPPTHNIYKLLYSLLYWYFIVFWRKKYCTIFCLQNAQASIWLLCLLLIGYVKC